VQILTPVVILGVIFIFRMSKELDILTFGESSAATIGLNVPAAKRVLLVAAAALTGGAIAFSGVIGFIDLVSPHIVRKIFGAGHRIVVPMSALFGGAFMVLCDIAARTLLPVGEIPVGAVTALIGAPFFAWLYFGGRKKDAAA
jgi:iron complex transport system permease protein